MRLMRPISALLLSAFLSLALNAHAAAAPSAVGLWEKRDDSGKPEGWFRIVQCNGRYQGKIVKIFPKPGQDPSTWRCTKCEDERRNAPVVGITFIKGMERRGLRYENGSILDPRDGSVYNAMMELSPDGQQLAVRGYLGIPFLGQTETWRRLPDNTPEARTPQGCS